MTGEPLILSGHDAAVHRSLVELRATLLQAAQDVDQVIERVVQTYNPMREAGASWADILAGQPKPLVISQLHDRINEAVVAGGALRRAVVGALLDEGVTKVRVAEIFGITHQRVSQISQDIEQASAPAPRSSSSRDTDGDL